jgi:prophage regulatory protein
MHLQKNYSTRFLRTQDLSDLLGLSRTTIWRWERDGNLPAARVIGGTAKRPMRGWLESDISDWLESSPQQRGVAV